ncbi:MAG: tRNA epoxyqueuosine(34) reductase QueG [Gammaproteobacteria bacterium]|nr:tRNA epoxyqueuosine(34) reductase QueG [Gammaproteobacteria bacterium]
MRSASPQLDVQALRAQLEQHARALGLSAVGVADIDIPEDERHLLRWLEAEFHGAMHYMERHGTKRSRPHELVPGTLRVISVALDYWPGAHPAAEVLADPNLGYVSRYALGRDYHKVLRGALATLARRLQELAGPFGYRVCVDTAPVLERAHARDAGLGWIGKHTNLIARDRGSYFFLGEILTDLPLPLDAPASAHCGSCSACLPACPTGAIIAPYQLDARRCISYLTIEHPGPIPEAWRAAIGNRIYGCDDCLAVCPWNKFARAAGDPDFLPREELTAPRLAELSRLDDAGFRKLFAGSSVKRTGRDRFVRNVLIAIGNAHPGEPELVTAARRCLDDRSVLVRAAAVWAFWRIAPVDLYEVERACRSAREQESLVREEWSHTAAEEGRWVR